MSPLVHQCFLKILQTTTKSNLAHAMGSATLFATNFIVVTHKLTQSIGNIVTTFGTRDIFSTIFDNKVTLNDGVGYNDVFEQCPSANNLGLSIQV